MFSHQNVVSKLQEIYSVFKIESNIHIIPKRCTILYYYFFNNKLLHVSNRLAADHQFAVGYQPVNITHDYTNCCFYRVEPPDDEQQVCSKHVEDYY